MLKNDTPSDPAILLDVAAVASLLGCSPRHVWRMADADEFPRPVAIGAKLKRWPRSAVLQWIDAQAALTTRH